MLVQIALLGKAVLASAHQTDKRLLLRMRSEVVEEIMPLAEDAVAA